MGLVLRGFGESLWLIGQEVRPSEAMPDRIDILAVDEVGNSIIIELKRGTHKLQLLQAVSYAGMVSRWAPDRFIETLAMNFSESTDEARAAIEEQRSCTISPGDWFVKSAGASASVRPQRCSRLSVLVGNGFGVGHPSN
jgi:hypothetical protein